MFIPMNMGIAFFNIGGRENVHRYLGLLPMDRKNKMPTSNNNRAPCNNIVYLLPVTYVLIAGKVVMELMTPAKK